MAKDRVEREELAAEWEWHVRLGGRLADTQSTVAAAEPANGRRQEWPTRMN